ncbi:MAG: hypothetical protein WC322_06980 [Candidatus Paceibacterota bacterium]|jgi:hypothetical protein
MRYLPIAALLVLGCRNVPDPCSPIASAVTDEACIQAISQALKECPGEAKVATCPEAQAVTAACAMVIRYQEARCLAR